MTEEMIFFIFLIECYAEKKNRSTGEVYKEWEKHNILNEIYDNYWVYHTESLENAYMDIDNLLATGKHAY